MALHDLHIASDSGFKPEKSCLPHTRTTVISEIKEWIHSIGKETSKQVYWLDGPAGAGKSAIAHTIAKYCSDSKLLGCMFCFSTSMQGLNPGLLFPTISRSLSNFDHEWGKALFIALQDNNDLCTTSSLQLQFQELLLNIALGMNERVVGPVVVVIDALDECGNDSARRELLSYIIRLTELPSFFRFLITTRSDQDMVDQLEKLKQRNCVNHCNLAELDPHNTDKDIYVLVDHKLSNDQRVKSHPEWNSSMINQLVQAAEQSFQWASTACSFIQGINESNAFNWHDRFEAVLHAPKKQQSGPKYRHLDDLYKVVLERLFPSSNSLERFKLIVGRVLAIKRPVSIYTLKELYGVGEKQQWTTEILCTLGSLLYGVLQEHTPIRLLHSSFHEFLTNSARSGAYFINLGSGDYDSILAHSTLRVMNTRLAFNMCQLKTSYCLNKEDENFDGYTQQYLSLDLVYSVQYWAEHLRHLQFSISLQQEIKKLLEDKALFWIESLSLLNQVHRVVPLLAIAKSWVSAVSNK
jgi:hypothetical protein